MSYGERESLFRQILLPSWFELLMRILVLCDCFLPRGIGGVEVLSFNLLKTLQKRGHKILVVTNRVDPDLAGRAKYKGIELFRIDFNAALAGRNLAFMQVIRRQIEGLIEEFKPDVLHINDAMPSAFFFLRGGATGNLPRVFTMHSPVVPGSNGLLKKLARQADRVVTVSAAQKADAENAIAGIEGRIEVIHNSLPFPKDAGKAMPDGIPRILCIGRMVPEKGFDIAVEALGILAQKGCHFTAVFAGNGRDKIPLEARVADLGLEAQVQFDDWVSPDCIPALLATGRVVLMPSRWDEPFGLVALQAAQARRPVVASARGGLVEIVVSGETGILIDDTAPETWATEVRKLIVAPDIAANMGIAAAERARTAFSFSDFVDAHMAVYRRVVSVAQEMTS